ncbi:pyridoxamine 5'-phosphate oxidase family protein [Roseateles cellulosilyticus]|uniref:Pyridoxamine 5'-phosphate oxidase family protein n=1 Tax=Pelomonas cellulosilytica TaxID=2906762 RepID=A0ABS8XUJ9_9BURK|nr:pyridoxamine 5'-phosphate oxidase family protein [Pelomonas sp. P8]MCE4556374.1 pyridoxamine 5'-phosphate oxidase family protein [Pelomonas sp. P8]
MDTDRHPAAPTAHNPGHADPMQSDARHDLAAAEAIAKIRDVIDKAETCFFVTDGGVRPMSVRQCDEDGTLWFLSDRHSHKNAEIEANPKVELYFQATEHSGFMHLAGQASVLHDHALIDTLWKPMDRVWFEQGKDDPCISVLCVQPTHGRYWDNKHGDAVAGLKMIVGAALGKRFDDGEVGNLTP